MDILIAKHNNKMLHDLLQFGLLMKTDKQQNNHLMEVLKQISGKI